MPRLLIAASGTGGHIFPALSVARALSKDWSLTWLGVPSRLENRLVPKKIDLVTVSAGGLQGNVLQKIANLLKLLWSTLFVIRLIRQRRIQLVFTTGGYISAPAILAAKLLRKPVIFHEANAYPGRVTRLLGRYCNVVALGFYEAHQYLPECKAIFTGTPVREAFLTYQSLPSWVPLGLGPLIVVMGGSQGALGLNQMVRPLFPYLLEQGCRLVHLTGNNDSEKYMNNYHINLISVPFSDEIPGLLQHADLVISRSGAGALSEFAVSGLPAILVPYPHSTDRHQEYNAVCFAQKAAALIVHQSKDQNISLKRALEKLLFTPLEDSEKSLLNTMRKSMLKIGVTNADKNLIQIFSKFI
tara:strand:- start:3643 stop:4713 length:1071 start_codon:yes stop_codon:yes gene_type:complete